VILVAKKILCQINLLGGKVEIRDLDLVTTSSRKYRTGFFLKIGIGSGGGI